MRSVTSFLFSLRVACRDIKGEAIAFLIKSVVLPA
jgi:hypothetical protein